ncbi:hypothetical protein HDU86_005473 [Geranomyces michiganensis]|nr:hypothetical protein HDU86_005473 [Geranomyces michiganensis]
MVQKTCFIQKLHTILESDQYNHLIRWSPAGTSFLVLDSAELSSQVLPTVFKHNNYTSFVRQLNLYGFHKKNRSYHRNAVNDADDKDPNSARQAQQHEPREFSHPKFLRFRPDLLAEIRRKPTAAQQQQMADQRKESSAMSHSDSESFDQRAAPPIPLNNNNNSKPPPPPPLHVAPPTAAAQGPSHSPVSPMSQPQYVSRPPPREHRHDVAVGHSSRKPPSSRSSFSSSPTAAAHPHHNSPSMHAALHELQSSMAKQFSYLQETVHHLSLQVRQMRDRNDMLEREVEALAGIRKRKRLETDDDRRFPVDADRRAMSPMLPFSSRNPRPSPPVLPVLGPALSGPSSSAGAITLPPPSALAAYNPTPYASPPVDNDRYHSPGYRGKEDGHQQRMRSSGVLLAPLVRDHPDGWKQAPVIGSEEWDSRSRGSHGFKLSL